MALPEGKRFEIFSILKTTWSPSLGILQLSELSGVAKTCQENPEQDANCCLFQHPTMSFFSSLWVSRKQGADLATVPRAKVNSQATGKRTEQKDYLVVPGHWLGAIIPVLFIITKNVCLKPSYHYQRVLKEAAFTSPLAQQTLLMNMKVMIQKR